MPRSNGNAKPKVLVRLHTLAATGDDGCLLLLEEIDGVRMLPILTGGNDGNALMIQISGLVPPRPQTHDLLVQTFSALGWSVERVEITEVRDDTFFARIELENGDETRSLDARPSDAVNIALRAECPIYVAESVFAKTDLVLKPIEEDELERFRSELASADVSRAFDELEGTPAPHEPDVTQEG